MNTRSNRGSAITTVLGVLLGLALAALLGFGVYLHQSMQNVSELFGKASVALSSVQSSVEAQDYSAAMAAAREAANYAHEASVKLNGVEWTIASKIPVFGADADIVRSAGSITGRLADEAILPVLDSWDVLVANGVIVNGQVDMSQVSTKLDQVVSLAETVKSASAVVESCKVQADTLPTSHFETLNTWVAQLKSTVASVDKTLDELEAIANIVTSASNMLSVFGNAA